MADRPVSRLQAGDAVNAEVYERTIAFFRQNKHEVVQIELLPFYPVPETYIYTENTSIGIPKSSLYKAFLDARAKFFATLTTHKSSPALETSQTLIDTSIILLLHDSEHLTAVNTRKRVLLSMYPSGTTPPTTSRGNFINPESEMTLLTSFFTSPLHRHSKSPILFAHRKWLLTNYPYLRYPNLPPNRRDASTVSKTFRKWARKEIDMLLRAADAHPKNYYAWTYARWLAEGLGVVFNHEDLVGWCLKHPGDVSGWSFLAWLWIMETASDFRDPMGRRRGDVLQERFNQFMLVLKYSHNTAPGHESLWGFVKAVVRQGVFDVDLGLRSQILDLLRLWDLKEWPARVADDVIKERFLVKDVLRVLEGRRDYDSEMADQA